MAWKPISEFPFPDDRWGSGDYWVTDGKAVVHAQLERRFGTPLSFYETRNGKMQIREDIPKWIQIWRFADMEAPENFCSSGPLPRDEVEFIPTHWKEWRPEVPSCGGDGQSK